MAKPALLKCLEFMEDFDDDELPDGAWQAMLMEAVGHFNEIEGTNLDPHETFLAYVDELAKRTG